ncbi:MAG: DNA polymerase III subunit chi [Holosporales bacterium]|jgi:DNA polymerase IIIc chi subunit|nr:DNA polymerase III subunit chi [Holosporales bacterium]
MPNRSVVFYCIESEFWATAYRLVEKLYSAGERLLFLCDNDDEVSSYSSRLWTYSKLAFIPSGSRRIISASDAEFCYVWFSTTMEFYNTPTCLLHNGLDMTKFNTIERFCKIMDVFNVDLMAAARTRSEFYKKNGFRNQKLWIQVGQSWKSENIT